MGLLVRTWNLFHGNTQPPGRHAYLEEMVRLVTADNPDVVCLQELPVWSLRRLEAWSGMRSLGAMAARPLLGSAELGRLISRLNSGFFRSSVTGQANAILLKRGLPARASDSIVLNPRGFRRREAQRLRLNLAFRVAWAKERRVCHAARTVAEGEPLVVANLHASSLPDRRVPDLELMRAASFADSFAEPGDSLVLAGDFNVWPGHSQTLEELTGPEWGFSEPIPGIDQILVRGLGGGRAERWADDRRRFDGRLLSDHAPVEVVIE